MKELSGRTRELASDEQGPVRQAWSRGPLLRFALVGGVGFLIDCAVLTLLMRSAGLSAWQARIPSFASAVAATWLLNRHLTFADRARDRPIVDGFAYAVTQT